MFRRRFLAAIGGSLGFMSVSGCAGFLPVPNMNDEGPEYPGGTLVIENHDEESREVSISVVEDQFSASFNTTISAGETVVEREFVTPREGDIATLSAQIDNQSESTTFEFLPGGDGANAPPEVARLSIDNSVTWTASQGTTE